MKNPNFHEEEGIVKMFLRNPSQIFILMYNYENHGTFGGGGGGGGILPLLLWRAIKS
jgi:hypothetical protein